MVASSNFGNVFSLLISSAWVPFNPMTPLQILVQNVLYDVSQIGIPWDHVDPEYLGVPQQWAIWDLLRFILILGPTSSTIDIATFCINWFYYGTRSAQDEHGVKLFQSQWYLVGLLTQTLVVYLLRTPKFPFIQSRPSKAVVMSSVPIMILGFLILYIPPFANALGVVRPGLSFLGFSAALVVLYVLVVQLVKMVYIKLFGRWL
jgi:Mg2+-importing ATPase